MTATATIGLRGGSRPWKVLVGDQVVEAHVTEERAGRGCDRLNRKCFACGELHGAHKDGCNVAGYVRDDSFGAEPDDSEGES